MDHLDGGREGDADLLRVIGEEAGGRGLDLPGPRRRLGVKVGRLTCRSHKSDAVRVVQSCGKLLNNQILLSNLG